MWSFNKILNKESQYSQSTDFFIAIAEYPRAVGPVNEIAQIIFHFPHRILRIQFESWLVTCRRWRCFSRIAVAIAVLLLLWAWRRRWRQIQRCLIPVVESRLKLLLIDVKSFRLHVHIVDLIVHVVDGVVSLQLLPIVQKVNERLVEQHRPDEKAAAIANGWLFLGQELVVYPKVKVVGVGDTQQLEEFHVEIERTCLRVEHSWTPWLSTKASAHRHSIGLIKFKVAIGTALLCERHKLAKCESVQDGYLQLWEKKREKWKSVSSTMAMIVSLSCSIFDKFSRSYQMPAKLLLLLYLSTFSH